MATLIDLLGGATIVALPDIHGGADSGVAREAAEKLICNSGIVKILFIEFQNISIPLPFTKTNETLNDKIQGLLSGKSDSSGEEEDEDEIFGDLKPFFEQLNANDAEPSLQRLAAAAVYRDINVLAADADYEKLGLQGAALFSDSGIIKRDTVASGIISGYLNAPKAVQKGRLLLWGDRHLTNALPGNLNSLLVAYKFQIHVATTEEMKAVLQ